ncbi:hypothetical protein NMY22_g2442 [Coprinellus aureogranulatus]|nr:hypothetical protein NMY22_g2442 [Coprinellus aureogranulatus]
MIHARHDHPSEVRRRAQMFDKLYATLRTHPNPLEDDLALLTHHLSQDYEVYDPLQRTLDALDVSLMPLDYPTKRNDALPQQAADAADAMMQLASIFRAINICHKPETEALHLYKNRAYTMVVHRWSEIARWMLYIISYGVGASEEGVVACVSALRMLCTQAPKSVYRDELLSQGITVNVVFLLLRLQSRYKTCQYWECPLLPTEPLVLIALVQRYCSSEVGLHAMTGRLSAVSRKTRKTLVETILVRARETLLRFERKDLLGIANSVSSIISTIKRLTKAHALCKAFGARNFLVQLTQTLCLLSETAVAEDGVSIVESSFWRRVTEAVTDVTYMAFTVYASRPSKHIAKLIEAGLLVCTSRCLPFATIDSRNVIVDVLRCLLPFLYTSNAFLTPGSAKFLEGTAPLPQDALAVRSACEYALQESSIALNDSHAKTCSNLLGEDWRNLHSEECVALAREYKAEKLDGSWCSTAMREDLLRLLLHFSNHTLLPPTDGMWLGSGEPDDCPALVSRTTVWTWDASHTDALAVKVGVVFGVSVDGPWKERIRQMSLLVENDPQTVLVEAFFRVSALNTVSTLAVVRYSPDSPRYKKYSAVASIFLSGSWPPDLYFPRWRDFSVIANATRNAPAEPVLKDGMYSVRPRGVPTLFNNPLISWSFPLSASASHRENVSPVSLHSSTGAALLATGAAVVVVPVVAPLALGAVGFSSGGVVAGSLAAGAQSYFYGAWTTGVFSALQAAGATAALPAAGQIVAGAGAMAAGAAALVL